MKLKIAQLGQPVLWEPATALSAAEIASETFQQLLSDMRETLLAENGVGLAGPQVYVSRQAFLACILAPQVEGEKPGIEAFINPRIVNVSEETAQAWEGCLSFPELVVLVERRRAVRIEYLNARGEPRSLDLVDFPARVVQHEFDHLNGILTIDRIASTRHIIKASEMNDEPADQEDWE